MNKQYGGFSLLELMIAIFVLSIGLLGMAAMQAVSLSSNQEAQFRVSALAIAEDISSRMRANRAYVNVSADKYTLIPDDHDGFNVYSTVDYNAAPGDPVAPDTVLPCLDPDTAVSATQLADRLNCRANEDISDIRRQLKPNDASLTNPTSGALLPAGSLMYVDCADKLNPDFAGNDDNDPCSPGSTYTIYVIWPLSAGREEAGQLVNGNNRQLINTRCANKLNALGDPISPENAGCVVMDVVP